MVTNNSINVATADSNTILQGQGVGTAPAFSTATYPATTTINQLLYSSANNTVAGLATANNGVHTTGTTGIPVVTALASNGQLIIGSGSGAPAAATLTGTANQIVYTNGANSITAALATNVVNSGQCAFSYFLETSDTNATGNGASYTLGAGAHVLTKIYDQNNNTSTTGTFTAPVTGIYFLRWSAVVGNMTSGMTNGVMEIVTTAHTYGANNLNWFAMSTGNQVSLEMTAIANMSANDTATAFLLLAGGAGNTATVVGSSNGNTYFSGFLIT